jgi:hypothetical protein
MGWLLCAWVDGFCAAVFCHGDAVSRVFEMALYYENQLLTCQSRYTRALMLITMLTCQF